MHRVSASRTRFQARPPPRLDPEPHVVVRNRGKLDPEQRSDLGLGCSLPRLLNDALLVGLTQHRKARRPNFDALALPQTPETGLRHPHARTNLACRCDRRARRHGGHPVLDRRGSAPSRQFLARILFYGILWLIGRIVLTPDSPPLASFYFRPSETPLNRLDRPSFPPPSHRSSS